MVLAGILAAKLKLQANFDEDFCICRRKTWLARSVYSKYSIITDIMLFLLRLPRCGTINAQIFLIDVS